MQTIRDRMGLEPSGRPAKSTNSLIEKLKRESIRLTQVQDISGCRIVVPDVREQDRVVDSLVNLFPLARVTDRRRKPSYGYRAVHVVVEVLGKPVEIQVRTMFQHIWGEISEKYADLYGSEIKYGSGSRVIRRTLKRMSDSIAGYEGLERRLARLRESDSVRQIQEEMRGLRRNLADLLDDEISRIENKKGEKQ